MQYFNVYSSECVEQFVSLMTDSFSDQKVQLAWNIVISFPLKHRTCFLLGILSVLNFMEFEKLDQRDLVEDYATCEMWKDQKKIADNHYFLENFLIFFYARWEKLVSAGIFPKH